MISSVARCLCGEKLLSLSAMPRTLDPELRSALAARIRYYNEMGIYDFYRRPVSAAVAVDEAEIAIATNPESGEEMSPRKAPAVAAPRVAEDNIFEVVALKPEQSASDPVKALKIIREDLGDCTRCPLHKQGRKQIVFGVGDPTTDLMFVGEGPGADEDAKGEPFVGRDLLSVSDAANRGRQTESDRGPRRDCGQDVAGDEFLDDATARAVLRLQTRRRPRYR